MNRVIPKQNGIQEDVLGKYDEIDTMIVDEIAGKYNEEDIKNNAFK